MIYISSRIRIRIFKTGFADPITYPDPQNCFCFFSNSIVSSLSDPSTNNPNLPTPTVNLSVFSLFSFHLFYAILTASPSFFEQQ